MASNRLQELDALRGIAALAVVIYHYTFRYNELYGHSFSLPLDILHNGRFGVQLFFIISGFVIFLTLERTKRPLDFVVSRFSRLYPAYWVGIMLTFSALTLFSLPDKSPSIQVALINFTMLQNWLGIETLEPVYWTLYIELSFYVVMFVLYISNQLKHINTIGTLWLLIIICAHWYESTAGIKLSFSVNRLLLLDYGHLFIAGIFFYKLKTTLDNRYLFGILLSLLVEFFMYFNVPQFKASALPTTIFFIVFLLFVKNKLTFIAIRPLTFLGTISYSLYLIHESIGYLIINAVYTFSSSPILILGIPVISMIFIATLINILIEKPSLKFIRYSYNKTG